MSRANVIEAPPSCLGDLHPDDLDRFVETALDVRDCEPGADESIE